jgi:tetratricopeptide (TPR) repeat protein
MAYQSEIEKLEQRYRENPDQWFAALADSYRKAGSLDLALDVVQAGLSKRPNYVSGHIVLGRCLLQKPDDVAANQAFEKVLALDAENVIALKALSEISERAGRLADAQRWLTRLLEVDPMNEEAGQALAKVKEAAATAAPAPAAEAVGAVEAVQAEMPGQVAPVAGFEATAAEPPPPAPAVEAVEAVETVEAARATPAPEEPAFTIEKSVEATGAEEEKVSLEALEMEGADMVLPAGGGEADAGAQALTLEPMEFETPAPEAAPEEAGVESMVFEPPSAADMPPVSPDLQPMEFEPPPAEAVAATDLGAQPFDSSLGWGTGERRSARISQADVEAAEKAREPALAPVVSEPEPTTDLPLIFPDEVTPVPPSAAVREGEAGGMEPEPVLTETMAELYAKQGLMAEARDIYRKLVAQRPGDAALAARLAALEPGVRAAAPRTGAPSARDFLAQVFGGEASPPEPPVAPSAAQGAPTRRASDEVSLASVFGEEVPAAPGAAPGAPGAGPRAAGQGFSFDEFFGAERGPAARPSSAQSPTSGGGEDEDDFKRWLKGLKS